MHYTNTITDQDHVADGTIIHSDQWFMGAILRHLNWFCDAYDRTNIIQKNHVAIPCV